MNDLVEVTWKELKSSMESKGIQSKLQWVKSDKGYTLFLFDGPLKLKSNVIVSDPPNYEQHDFESNFKPKSNMILEPIDGDNSQLSRIKVTKQGWNFQLHSVEFETGKKGSLVNEDENGQSLGFATLKFFDAENNELTGDQAELDASAVKTVLDWEPTHDYEIRGGFLKQKSVPPSPIRVYVIGVPDIPAPYGGSKKFTQGGLNLEFFGTGEMVDADGQAPKFLKFDGNLHTNKLRVVAKHGVGVKHAMSMVFKLFVA